MTQPGQLKDPQRELFCKLYISDKEFFGNGVRSYAKAYNLDLRRKGAYRVAASTASELLTKPDILKRTNELLEANINDIIVDKELGFVILQKTDLHAKVAGIREYNQLKQRIVKKIEHSGGLEIKDKLSEEELDARIAELERKLKTKGRKSPIAAAKNGIKGQ